MPNPPRRQTNSSVRDREHLTPTEVELLIEAAKHQGRHGARDALAIRMAYAHGLRASELCNLRWTQVDLREGRLHVTRLKRGSPSTHPLQSDEIRALRKLQGANPHGLYVFVNERGTVLSPQSFGKIVRRAGAAAKLGLLTHPHMLRHATGFAMVNMGYDIRHIQVYLGHRSIQHTARYAQLSAAAFNNLRL